MSDDLVKRLRSGAIEHPKRWSGDTHHDLGGTVDEKATDDLMNTAADEITRLKAELEELEAKLAKAVEGFEKLARLGNGDSYGNSFGNLIAQQYLAELKGETDG